LAANVSVALGREWSKFTNSHVHFDAEEEITRVLEFDVPPWWHGHRTVAA